MSTPPKACNVKSRSKNNKKCRKDANGDEMAPLNLNDLMSTKGGRKMLSSILGRNRESWLGRNWLFLIDILWFGITFMVGLYVSRDGFAALGYLIYHVIIFFYLIFLSIIPGFGIYTLLISGNVESSLAGTFSVNLSNPWIAYMVNGLYFILGWIIQVVVIFVIVVIIIAIIAKVNE